MSLILSPRTSRTSTTLQNRVREKERKHSAGALLQRCGFLPFVLSSHGGWTKEALSVLDMIEERSGVFDHPDELTPKAFLLASVSVALQRGNAVVMEQGLRLSLSHPFGRLA